MNDLEYIRERVDHIVDTLSRISGDLLLCNQKVNKLEERFDPVEKRYIGLTYIVKFGGTLIVLLGGIAGLIYTMGQILSL